MKRKADTEKRGVADYVIPQLGVMLGVFAVKFMGSFVELFLPSILSYMVDDIAPEGNIKKMFLFGGIMILCAFIALVGNICANRMASKIASGITRNIRHDVYSKTISLSCEDADRFTSPTLISRLTSDTYNVHNMLLMVQRLGVRAPIMVIGGVIITFFLDPILTLILLALMPIVFTAVFFISRRGVKMYGKVQKTADGMVSMLREHMEGVRVIKALSKTEYERKRFGEINEEIYKNDRNAALMTGLSGPVMSLILNFGLTAVIFVGAFRVSAGKTDPGVIIAFLSYFTIILNAMMMISRLFMQLSKGLASAKRLDEVLSSEAEPSSDENAADKIDTPYMLSFDDVSFSYLKTRNNVENLSFGIRKGETLGIIGATGSGKSTIISLILRFYKPDKGTVRINGEDISGINRERLYSMFGSALQTDFLMSDSISENIRFGREIDTEEMELAAVSALADGFIREKDGGYSHKLDVKAANLSGGQKQRLLISRALASHPEILILDDSCGGLDYKTDSVLRHNLGKNYGDCTKVIVAQRISTIMNADLIIVMDDGKVVGMGDHDKLMKECELYRETAAAQMELK